MQKKLDKVLKIVFNSKRFKNGDILKDERFNLFAEWFKDYRKAQEEFQKSQEEFEKRLDEILSIGEPGDGPPDEDPDDGN